jgi:hypothetical protein
LTIICLNPTILKEKTMKNLLLIGLLLTAGICFSQTPGSAMYVAVKTAPLKTSPGIFSRTTAALNLGDAVTVITVQGNWVQVRAGIASGWTQLAGLRARVVTGTGPATATEVSLAGKGFSGPVEAEYRMEGGGNYAAVDAMEQIVIPDDDLLDFIVSGRLNRGN